ncbi:hypothetical protein L1987_84794 [Smallanthus sonchifolius]|uniref:Uncharacterized protein n=1 Tax=Smallanthus sonchifolius TaxID=185202 RepID=A0ACB8XVD4_9ASTR|nr:hypothetical protein L1987_84794 [Smallanthus sonchifolius]
MAFWGSLWMVRGADQEFDPYEVYANEPTMFSLKIFHGGKFANSPNRKYINGLRTLEGEVREDTIDDVAISEKSDDIGSDEEEDDSDYIVDDNLVEDPEVDMEDFRQKGLVPALSQMFPCAEHRYCLRHIHDNMKSKWRGGVFKNMFWCCASATTVPLFERKMEEIRQLDSSLYGWLKQIPTSSWSRAHFSGDCKK